MKESNKNLAAKILLVAALTGTAAQPSYAGIPVIDATNLTQGIMTAIESVAQTAKQIQQYQTQLQQYENMLQNSLAPAAYIWDQAQNTINNLENATNTLQYYQNQLGSIDQYLDKFQDTSYYRSSPCFSSTGCTETERASMETNRLLASEAQKKASDAIFQGLELQQENLKDDAAQLNRLQSSAQGADGQLAAIGYANQIAANQSNQLLQIRSLLMAQQNAIATQMQAENDRQSQYEASGEQLRKGAFVNSPSVGW